jgi:hypothetical protein
VGSEDAGPARQLGPGSLAAELTDGTRDAAPVPPAVRDGDSGGRHDAEPTLLDDEHTPTDELTAYNRYLAMLAVRGKPKTWRNPRGL